MLPNLLSKGSAVVSGLDAAAAVFNMATVFSNWSQAHSLRLLCSYNSMQQFEGWKEFISLSIAVHLASTFLTPVVSYNMPQDHETTTKPEREQK